MKGILYICRWGALVLLAWRCSGSSELRERLDFSMVVQDYDVALDLAALHQQPILLIFSGYGLPTSETTDFIYHTPDLRGRNNYIWCELMVDDRAPLGDSTVGRRNAWLQRHQYKRASYPTYYIINAQEELLKGPLGYCKQEQLETFLNDTTITSSQDTRSLDPGILGN